ncbi:uncharacterized protein TA10935 [Theileria annulata]|uniref:Ribosomal RNA-processing protein 43 n=1 Tax=Theileria annulata TaxID=5874 RepID=Q4U981_THEAN|nr:uncharacterized protein TA10935 [Theileria annulata]CAI76622.1 hypothetical protein TA10935 [Theileria annulata]|eukprot:XP_953247.1 hypothetical protein TA10935 [Theileria annulata]
MEDRHLTLSQDYKVASEVYRHVDPLNFYENFLNEGIRPDGRKLCSYRKTSVKDLINSTFSSDDFSSNTRSFKHELNSNKQFLRELKKVLISSIYLTCGNSHYNCKLMGDLMILEDLPAIFQNTDVFSVSVLLPKHVVNEVYDINGPCINITHLVSDLIEKVLNSSEIVPRDQFCYDILTSSLFESQQDDPILKYLNKNKLRWKLSMEIACDEYDGNLLDMCFLACSYCLLYSKFPFILLYPESNQFYPSILNKAKLEHVLSQDREILCMNNSFLKCQFGSQFSLDRLEKFLLNDDNKRISINYVPYTVTFCKCLNYYLLDPTREDEQIGVNFSIYSLKKFDSEEVHLQPLNLMGLTGVVDDDLNKMYDIARVIVKSFQ